MEQTGKEHLERTDFIIAKQKQEAEQAKAARQAAIAAKEEAEAELMFVEGENKAKEQYRHSLDSEIAEKEKQLKDERKAKVDSILDSFGNLVGVGKSAAVEKENTKLKAENDNKRTKRKEIQFSEAEYAVVEQKANAARLSVAAFIREAALGKELSAALTIEESERIKRTANISYKMQVNLNQIARLVNIHGLPFVTDAIREYICRTNEYFKTGIWHEMDLSAYESEQKQREQLAAKVRELQEKNTELQKAATNYYLYTAEGERLFCERHNCRIYPDNRGIYWHFKVGDYPAYTLPAEISKAYLNHEISIRDVYVYWRKNEK